METVKTGRIKSFAILALLAAAFVGCFLVCGPGVYNDSDQYIQMHIHREPLYPLFLWILRTLFGTGYLAAMGIVQAVFAAVSIWLFAEYISKTFSLHTWEEILIILLELLPYIVTSLFSVTKLFIPNSVMSEALCIPLFTLFVMECFKMFTEEKKGLCRAALPALVLAVLLSLTRSQMLAAILVWMVVLGAKVPRRKAKWQKKLLRLCGIAAVVVLAFSLRLLAVKCYNLVFNGHFINNTYGAVNTLTNILYASDREDGENIKDEEAREFFYLMYDMAKERQANYRYAGASLGEKAAHIEQWHDTIKYEIIEDMYYQTYKKTIVDDYIIINLRADETSMKIIMGIFPKCFFRWFGNYLALACYGLIRSVAVVHPVLNWFALLLYLWAILMAVLMIRKNRKDGKKTEDAVWFLALALLVILANVFTVAITIMTLSRYMIYGFSPFYTACFVLLIQWIRTRQRKDKKHGL